MKNWIFKKKFKDFLFFLVRTLQCFYFSFFYCICPWKTWKNRPQKLLIIDPNFFFSNADWPKSSPNFNSCSIKISRRGTSLKWLWYEIDYIRLIMNANYLSHALNSRNMKVFDKKHSSVSSVIEDVLWWVNISWMFF